MSDQQAKSVLRIQLLSDLHLDIHEDQPDIPETDADMIILAGDIAEGIEGMLWAMQQADRLQKPVLYLSGNHEYYRGDAQTFDEKLRSLCANHPFVRYLQMDSYDIGNYRILGATLWTSFELSGYADFETNMRYADNAMSDYRCIDWGRRTVTPADTRQLHVTHQQWIEDHLKQAEQDNKTAIVVTHHAPHPKSIAPQYQASRLNPAFVNDLSPLFGQTWSPAYWLHGHTHDDIHYRAEGTIVIASPRGYPEEREDNNPYPWDRVLIVN
ncbi:MAG: metallophosphoesterase [Gammaproteobacteria bacterium]|nr:metallophosphoesterase [Gammaproteobacteria bacterium]